TTYPSNRTGMNALSFRNSNYLSETNLYSAAAEYTGKTGEYNHAARITYVNQDEPRSVESAWFPMVDIRDGVSGSAGNVLTSFGTDPFTYGNLRYVKTLNANYDISRTFGAHDVTLGAQYESSITKNGFQRFGTGFYMFNSWEDFVNDAKPIHYALTFPMTPD